MNVKKRAIPIVILALMVLSMVPFALVHAAIGSVIVSDSSGQYGDTIIVTGSGVTAGEVVQLGWDGLKAWDGVKGILNSTEADGAGDFEIWFDVPEAVIGSHYIWLKDVETGATWGGTLATGSEFSVLPLLKFSPSSGLEGYTITAKGYGFTKETDIVSLIFDPGGYAEHDLTMSPGTPETSTVGSWTATWKVPDEPYGTYTVEATDDDSVSTTKDFDIGAFIQLDIDMGPTGSVVEIDGFGFTQGVTIEDGLVWIDGTSCTVIDDDTIGSDEKFTVEIVIPSVATGEYEISVYDGTWWAYADFEVDGVAEIEVTPSFGVQGTTVQVHGYNFSQILNKNVVIELWTSDWSSVEAPEIKTFKTTSAGEFSGSFTVPAIASDPYRLNAYQEDYNINGSVGFRVGMIIVILSPSSGPAGTKVIMTGTGFTTGTDTWNASFGDLDLIEDGDVDDNGNLKLGTAVPTFFVPSVDPGTYTITILDIEEDISVDVEFTVTTNTRIWTEPAIAPNNYEITILGEYFSAVNETDIVEFLLYNVTAEDEVDFEWELDLDAMTNEDGEFEVDWTIFEEDDLSLGEYILEVTDDNGMYATYILNVVEKTQSISPRKDTFANGETVAFNILVSFPEADSYIEIYDPDGELYWQTDAFTDPKWIKVGTVNVVPYFQQVAGGNPMTLMDAALGTWSWTWFDYEEEELDSGTFAVTEAPEDILATQIAELGLNLDGLMEDFVGLSDDLTGLSGDVSTLSGNLATLAGSVSSLASDVSSLAGDVANAIQAANTASGKVDDLAETVADIAEVASNAATAAQNAAQAATAAQTAAEQTGQQTSGLTTLVYGAIGAALVAALAAIVSLMQISRRIAG